MVKNEVLGRKATARIGRRAFVGNGALVLATAAVGRWVMSADLPPDALTIGLVTDLHYADKPPAGSRHYRQTLDKLAAAAAEFGKHDLQFVVELGDFVDAADSVAAELGYLRRIDRDFATICDRRHYVLGNHCVHTLTKQEFLDGVGQQQSYYSFDAGEIHFIVLDSCFRGDGQPYGRKNFHWTDANIPATELEWLKADLATTTRRCIVLAHQRLDVSNNHGVKNGPAVRRVLEESGKVLAVFQGHSHKNDLSDIGGIHYCTMVAMVEGSGADNNGFSIIKIAGDGTIQVDGFSKQTDYRWKI